MRRHRLIVAAALALGIAGTLGFTGVTSAQQPTCLHDQNETPDQAARRQSALRLTRDINTTEYAGFTPSRSFLPFEQLHITAPIPQGFETQLVTDGKSYAFSVKDLLDRCGFAYFSDSYQDGRIYVGQGLR